MEEASLMEEAGLREAWAVSSPGFLPSIRYWFPKSQFLAVTERFYLYPLTHQGSARPYPRGSAVFLR